MKCVACSRMPAGPEGHFELFVLKLGGSRMQFHCRTCSTLWVRTHADDRYRWAESARELEAVPLPGPRPFADR